MREPGGNRALKLSSGLITAIFVTLSLGSPLSSLGATYYISFSGGRNTNDGLTPATAWKSLDQIFVKSVSGSAFKPGDRVLLKRGDIWDGQVRLHAYGSETNPIVLSSYGSGPRPVIIGDNPGLVWSAVPDHPGLYRSSVGEGAGLNRGYQGKEPLKAVRVPRIDPNRTTDIDTVASQLAPGTFSVTGNTVWFRPFAGLGLNGVRLFRSSLVDISGVGLIIEDLDLRRAGSGIYLSFANHVTVRNNNVEDMLGLGVLLSTGTTQSAVEHNTVSRTGNDSLYVLHGESNTLRFNIISQVRPDVMGFTIKADQCGIGLQESKLTLVEHNEGHFIRTAVDYYLDEGSIIRYNYFDNIGGALNPHGTDLWVYGNIFNLKWQNGSGKAAINAVNTGAKPIRVFNNVFFRCPRYGLRASSSQGPIILKSNIVHSSYPNPILIRIEGNVTSDYECMYANGVAGFQIESKVFRSFKDYRTSSLQDLHSLVAPPEFVAEEGINASDFRLRDTSGCVGLGAGVESESLLPRGQDPLDFAGDKLPSESRPSAGAFWNPVPARNRIDK